MTKRGRYWQRWLVKWERSGLTQAEFCRRHGLKGMNFGWWKGKLREPEESLGPILRRRGGRSPAEFVELAVPVSSPVPSRCSWGYELVLPRGVVIRVAVDLDLDRVAQLITAAASAC